MSMALIQRRNNVVCPVGRGKLLTDFAWFQVEQQIHHEGRSSYFHVYGGGMCRSV